MDIKTIKKVTKRRTQVLLNPIKNYLTAKDYNRSVKYAKWYKRLPIKNNYVLYETREGKSMTDSPYAIFKYLLHDLKWKDLVHVWVVSDKAYLRALRNRYKSYHNVKFVLRDSDKYYKYLVICKYLFNNSTFQNAYTVKEGQVYTNTWHGTPLKYMGFDLEGQPLGSSNVVRNFLSAKYILSPNTFTTNIFKNAFKLKNLYNGLILEEGYPRIDLTVNANKNEVKQLLRDNNINLNNRKLILYAPTWKGEKTSKPRNDIEQIYNDINRLEKVFDDDYKVVVKVHPFLYPYAKSEKLLEGSLVSDSFDTNELLSVTDILITDYSSIFFDYLVTGKPILFYMWDYEDYNQNRGMYIDTGHLPGPVATDLESLIYNISNIEQIQKDFEEKYNSFADKFCYHEYGNVTHNVVMQVFGLAKTEQNNSAISVENKDKKKILIYPGGLQNNGITGALLNLLDNIDYQKYDVTVLINYTHSEHVKTNMLKINSNARLIFKSGRIGQTLLEHFSNYIVKNRGVNSQFYQTIFPSNMYRREYKRIVGNAEFDYAIDFSGYAMFWPNVLLAGDAKKKMILMHSDMYSDMHRNVNGKRPHLINLRGVFSLYKYFDELISVSEATMEVNKENLKDYIGNTKVSYMINSLNADKIEMLSNDDSEVYFKNNKPVLVSLKGKEIVDIPMPKQDSHTNFVNMGRLSPEKGQDQLIEAFAMIHNEYEDTTLYIIGDGPSKGKLKKMISAYGLEESVFLVGHKSNPFYLMSHCDAFVLSSHYEGHPLVLLESQTLGLEIVSTDIIASRYVLEGGKYGILVENSVEGLAKGMASIVNGNHKTADFDVKKYNEIAMGSFYQTL